MINTMLPHLEPVVSTTPNTQKQAPISKSNRQNSDYYSTFCLHWTVRARSFRTPPLSQTRKYQACITNRNRCRKSKRITLLHHHTLVTRGGAQWQDTVRKRAFYLKKPRPRSRRRICPSILKTSWTPDVLCPVSSTAVLGLMSIRQVHGVNEIDLFAISPWLEALGRYMAWTRSICHLAI